MQYLTHSICAISGILLFGIGFIGVAHLPVQPAASLTVLLKPLGGGDLLDLIYWEALMVLGIWLILCIWVRVPASISLCFVIGKIAVLNNIISLNVAITIIAVISALVVGIQAAIIYHEYSN